MVSIGADAFQDTNISSVTIPEGVTRIKSYAFRGTPLEKITIPSTVDSLEVGAFAGCNSLREATMLGTLSLWQGSTAYAGTFENCRQLTTVTIARAEKIPASSFKGCTALYNVTFPKELKAIGSYAFYGCISLPRLSLPNKLQEIGAYAFFDCTKLRSVSLPESLVTIEEQAFCNAESLTNINLPSNLKKIGKEAFKASGLTSISIPGTVAEIPEGMCHNCFGLLTIDIGEGTVRIGKDAFRKDMPAYFDEDLEEWVIRSCSYSVTLPSTIQIIELGAFYLADWYYQYYADDEYKYDEKNHFGITSISTAACETRWNDIIIENDKYYYSKRSGGYPKGWYYFSNASTGIDAYVSEGHVADDLLEAHITFAEHSYEYRFDDSTHWLECTGCGEPIGDLEEHTIVDGKCSVCGYGAPEELEPEPDTPACNHVFEYVSDVNYHWQICQKCGEVVAPEKHAFTEGVCACGAKELSKYDVNGDGKVTLDDAIETLKKAMNVT